MGKKQVFCAVVAFAVICGLASQMTTLNVARAEEVPMQASDAVSVSTFEELLGAFDSTWEADAGVKNITLTQDIQQGYEDSDYMVVNLGWTVTLDLNGHMLELRNDGPRGLQNYGTLIVTGNGILTNGATMNESYGLIDNYGGKLVIQNGTFIDYGQGGGATLKNRTVQLEDNTTKIGELTIEVAKIHAYATAGGNACVDSDGVLNINDGVEMQNDATDEVHGSWFGSYAMTVRGGNATIGRTPGNSLNPVVVRGNRGGFAVNSGNVVVNNGVFSGESWYGMWITNDGAISDVNIEYAEASGAKYGVYSTVDDGKQDLSDVHITIKDGKYSGGTKAAVAINKSKSEHSFGMSIEGGEYSSTIDESYVATGKVVFETDDKDYPYAVDEAATVNFPEIIYLAVGEEYDLNESLNASAKKYGEFSISGDAEFNDFVLVGKTVGESVLRYALPNESGEIRVIVYSANAASDDAMESQTEAEMTAAFATKELANILKNGESASSAIKLIDGEINGVHYDGIELVKVALLNGYKIETTLARDLLEADRWEETSTYNEILGMLNEEESIAALYDGNILLVATNGDDVVVLGSILELENPVTLAIEIPEDYLATKDGIVRKFYVVRGHEDKAGSKIVNRLEAVQSGKYLIVETDRFSTFAITYVDIEEETGLVVPNTGMFTKGIIDPASREDYTGLINSIIVMTLIIMTAGLFKGYRRIQRKIYRGK